jgi:HK97 family phage prohead protease
MPPKPQSKIEHRTYSVELRVDGEGESPKIAGYAAVFDQPSEMIGGMFIERLSPGSFTKALRGKPDVLALWNHDANYPLGRSTAGTLRMSQDDTGLAVEIDPPDTQWANDLITSMKRGDIRNMSFAFTVSPKGEQWSEDAKGIPVRTITEVSRLFDVSVVSRPAYPQTSVAARGDDCDPEDMLEMLSGRAFDECFLACLIEEAGDILEIAALAATRAGDPSIIDLAARLTAEATAEVAMLRDFQTRFLAGEAMAPPPMEENSLPPPPYRLALLRRRLELLKAAH